MKVAILQPEVPHYREEFFSSLSNQVEKLDVYIYNSPEAAKKQGFDIKENDSVIYIKNKKIGGFLWYSIRNLFGKKYDTLVLMLHIAHLTTWLLLLTKRIHRRKIILWGQGISVKRYLAEEKNPDWKLKMMIKFSDGVWLYTEKEYNQWKEIFPKKKIVALCNTFSGVDKVLSYEPLETKDVLKNKYNIKEPIVFIYCARFESDYRRTDLLIDTIKRLDSDKYAYIIIGEGKNKPDFSRFKNVYDFGAIYDVTKKHELFTMADVYYQPGWVGLSVVEAMAYGKPILTFKRSECVLQCVEYSYLIDNYNSVIVNSVEELEKKVQSMSTGEIVRLGNNARQYVRTKLTMSNMVDNALFLFK
ncbi:MAG: glycosyltransferase [Paludibacteraceae bacterium]|nr:glycosyltransferase [Paludibacteraceae bacterium]